jgi:CBS domain-containing protein
MTVRDLMTGGERLVAVSPDTTLKEAAELMLEHGISGFPVVDADRHLVGVVSEGDIVSGEAGGTGREGMLARAQAFAGEPAGLPTPRTVAEAMSSPAITIRADEPVVHAARLIAGHGVNRLPVVDEDHRLVGILTRADVVRAFVRSDDDIAAEIRTRVVERLLGLEAGSVQVAVADGEATLTGEVDTAAHVTLVEYFASRVPGVVAVRSELRAADPAD